MKNPKLIHKKRLRRKKIAARHLKSQRDLRYLTSLPRNVRIKVLEQRIYKARIFKQMKKNIAKKKAQIQSVTQTNKQIKV